MRDTSGTGITSVLTDAPEQREPIRGGLRNSVITTRESEIADATRRTCAVETRKRLAGDGRGERARDCAILQERAYRRGRGRRRPVSLKSAALDVSASAVRPANAEKSFSVM